MAELRLYRALAHAPLSFRNKILAVAFVGTHIPLFALIAYFLVAVSAVDTALAVLAVAVAATLAGTAMVHIVVAHLLRPVSKTSQALEGYLNRRDLPDLPRDYPDEVGQLMAHTQVTLERLDETIDQLAYYDANTGLPNRDHARLQLGQALEELGEGQILVVAVVQLRGLTGLGTALGGDALDQAVREIGLRWVCDSGCWRIVARARDNALLGAIVLDGDSDPKDRIQSLLVRLNGAVAVGGRPVQPVLSAGLAWGPEHSADPQTLMAHAETALDVAADPDSGVSVAAYTHQLGRCTAYRLSLLQDLRAALEQGGLAIHYQPFVDRHGTTIGAEALIRWYHTERGWISPGDFIPVAEREGLIGEITAQVLDHAVRQTAEWLADSPNRRFILSVNLSARDLLDTGLPGRVSRLLAETGLRPERLQLEVTETAVMQQLETAFTTLQELSELGLRIALDDFGTGYSSLAYMRRIPWDVVKIDRAFVRGIDSDNDNQVLCRSIVAVTEAFGRKALAEGVETAAERDALTGLGIDSFQGFYFAKPAAAEAFDLGGEARAAAE